MKATAQLNPAQSELLASGAHITAHINHGFFGRTGGTSSGIYASLNCGLGSGDDQSLIDQNRTRASSFLGVGAASLLTPYQIHSADVTIVESAWVGPRPHVDGLVTRMPGLAIGVVTADCVPVLLADHQIGIIGAAHAGWKGALAGVIEATVSAMTELGADRANIHAAIGPAISQSNYQVGTDYRVHFEREDPTSTAFFDDDPNQRQRCKFDLPGYVASKLRTAQIQIFEDLSTCTYANEEFYFSYRRSVHRQEADYGRNLSAIALRDA